MKLDEQLKREFAGVGWPNGFKAAPVTIVGDTNMLVGAVLASEEKRQKASNNGSHAKRWRESKDGKTDKK